MSQERHSLARDLGAFFGHIWQGVRADVTRKREPDEHREGVAPDIAPNVVGATREETIEREHRNGKVILRRTIVEEVEMQGARDGTMGDAGGVRHPASKAESRMPNAEP